MNTRYTHPKRRAAMASAVRSGDTISAVARRYGCATKTVRTACWEHGVATGRAEAESPPVSSRTMRILARLFGQETMSEIARDEGVTTTRVSQVYRDARAAGVPVPVRRPGNNLIF